MDAAYDNQKYGDWIITRRRELELTEEEFAVRLEVHVTAVLMWELGKSCWATLPREIKTKIEALCGKFPSVENAGIQQTIQFRQPDGTLYQDTILTEIQEHATESVCSRCHTTIPLKAAGKCPECGKIADGSQ